MITINIEKQQNITKTSSTQVGAGLVSAKKYRSSTNAHGITLIALVITIIILLILAGVVLNLTLGEHGIFKKAEQAGKSYDEAGAREKLELALVDLQTQKIIDSTYNETTYIDNYLTKKHMTVDGNIVTVGKWQFEIDRSVPKIASTLGTGDEIITEQKANLIAGNMIDGQVILKIEAALTNDTIQRIEIYDETDTKIETLSIPTGIKQIQKEQEIYVEFMENKSYYAKIIGQNRDIQTNTVSVQKNENAITSAKDLKKLATLVNSGETFEGKTITQVADIDLSTVCGNGIGNWESIGHISANIQWFNGTYDGKGKKVTNLYIDNTEDKTVGLFGLLGYKGTVKNVTVYGEVTQNSDRAVAGIVGRNEGIIDNCTNYANVTSVTAGVSGISGNHLNTVRNCVNNGKITGLRKIGGIIGDIGDNSLASNNWSSLPSIVIDNCTNTGEITAIESIAGGIAGSSSVDITKCKNTGTVTSNGNPDDALNTQGTGGIVGRTTANVGMSSNEGTITSKGYFGGGIVGLGGKNTNIGQCYNKGSIEIEKNAVGGIVGCTAGGIWNCYNYLSGDKKIKATWNAGGIMGNAGTEHTTTIENCYSIGENIIGNSNASILGAYYLSGSIVNKCYYVSGSSLDGIGTERGGDLAKDNIIAKNLNDFKLDESNTNSVTYMLKTYSPSLWAQDANINEGLPYLVNNNR